MALTVFQEAVLIETTNSKNKLGQGNKVCYRNLIIDQLLFLLEANKTQYIFARLADIGTLVD